MRFVTIILLASCCLGHGATLYVATNGLDSNPGTLAQPWLTIQKAASNAVAGDTVIIQAGEYREYVTNLNSGSDGSPITFTGERGSGGEWLTIIDPSTPITNGWSSATAEVGAGVWKQTGMAFTTREVTIDNKRVAVLWSNGEMADEIDQVYASSGITSGTQLLAVASDATLTMSGTPRTVFFWDGIEALSCSTGAVTYLRIRDGRDPNGMNIRAARNDDSGPTTDVFWRAISIVDKSHIVYSNMLVRGAYGGFWISGTSSHDIVLHSNYVAGGYARIVLGTGPYSCKIQNNTITTDYYGWNNPGAWTGGTSSGYYVREILYGLSKYLMGGNTTYDDGIVLVNTGTNNIVANNYIHDGIGNGINIRGYVASPVHQTLIFRNTIERMPSTGIIIQEGQWETRVFNNSIRDCNANIRFHHMDTVGETNRLVYVYRNRLWLPSGSGEHMYVHFTEVSGDPFHPEHWIYHNSFSGGKAGISVSGYTPANGGIPNFNFLNNIFSGSPYVLCEMAFATNASMIGSFDYNLVTPITYPISTNPAWYGIHNTNQATAEWDTNNTTMELIGGSKAINAALDVSTTFTIGGTNHTALPASAEVMLGPAWDMGAMEYSISRLRAQNLRAGTLRGK